MECKTRVSPENNVKVHKPKRIDCVPLSFLIIKFNFVYPDPYYFH